MIRSWVPMAPGPNRCGIVAACTLACVLATVPAEARAQSASTVGVVLGYSSTEQIWKPTADVESVAGLVVGAWLAAAAPPDWLTVLAEGTYTQRGGDVEEGGGATVEGAVRSDYLSVSVRPRVGTRLGRARLSVAGGPAFDLLLRSRVAPGFEPVLVEEGSTVFGVLVGAGLDISIGRGRILGLEARLFEGLADAYSGDFVSLRNRTWEVVARFGMTLNR